MPFSPWTAKTNDQRAGYFSFVKQAAAGVYVPTTKFLRETGGGAFLPDVVKTSDKYFAGSLYTPPMKVQGIGYDGRSVNVEMDAMTIALAIQAMFGPADVTSKIVTPNPNMNWSDDLPVEAWSLDWYQPSTGHVYVTDAQLHELDITIPAERDNLTGTLMFHGRKAVFVAEGATDVAYTPSSPVIPAFGGAFGRLDSSLTIGGAAAIRDGASTLKFTRPIDPLAANGIYTGGYKPGTGNVGLEITETLNRGRPDLIALADTAAFVPVVWTLLAGTIGITVAANCQISARETPLAQGAVQTNLTFTAVSATPGATPFTVKLVGTIPGAELVGTIPGA